MIFINEFTEENDTTNSVLIGSEMSVFEPGKLAGNILANISSEELIQTKTRCEILWKFLI